VIEPFFKQRGDLIVRDADQLDLRLERMRFVAFERGRLLGAHRSTAGSSRRISLCTIGTIAD
jgi:hypothetical protein